MSDLLVVIADEDESYLMPLELKFVEELQDKAEIVVITTDDYLQSFFSKPKKIDILIINKSFYSHSFDKHDIENIFILVEEESKEHNEIYKYTSVTDIYDYVVRNLKAGTMDLVEESKSSKCILIYSPVGGSGKTTLAMGISGIISNYKKKVLYISTESIQSFGHLIDSTDYLPRSFKRSLINKDFHIVDKMMNLVKIREFDYLPPINQATSIEGIGLNQYNYLINKLKELNIYDYIIIDSTSELDTEKSALMGIADKVVIVTNQNRMAVSKIDILLENIDCSDGNKFIFICNKYDKTKENYLMTNIMKNTCVVKQYIRYIDEEKLILDNIIRNEELQGFVYSII